MLYHWKSKSKHARFSFGHNALMPVTHVQQIPIQLKNKLVFYEAHIVQGRCPALVGLASMRRMKAIINCGNDMLGILEVLNTSLVVTTRNHYVLPLKALNKAR